MLKFNIRVSQYISKFELENHLNLLKRDGVIKRDSYIPQWLRNALLFRDKGRCINCGKDLTGVFLIGEKIHYDHIVPLAKGGINDPSNLQILWE